jgi:hypothetical protein
MPLPAKKIDVELNNNQRLTGIKEQKAPARPEQRQIW